MCYSTPGALLRSPYSELSWVDDLVDDLFEPRMEVWPASRLHRSFFNRSLRDLQTDWLTGWAGNRLRTLDAENGQQRMKLLEDDESEFRLTLNAQNFKPEEIKCKTDGRYLTVEGVQEREEADGKGYVKRQFERRVLLPESAEVDKVNCVMAADGRLNITIPKKAPEPHEAIEKPKETPIAIQHEK